RYWKFIQAVKGISDACKFFDLSVVSGNVSFYNESPAGPIHPTPTIGMIGIIEDIRTVVHAAFKENGDLIVLFGESRNEIGGSEYLRLIHQQECGPVPHIDLQAEKNLQELLIEAAQQGLVQSSSDLSEGGLACALGEGCICGQEKKGCLVDIGNLPNIRLDALLFGESCGRALITCKPEKIAALESIARKKTVPFFVIGKVTGKSLMIYRNQQLLISVSIEDLWDAWHRTL
ncbi:MAG: phosphoribosylformylglycinamidine synthase II, partial [Candidatus Atribacteria bacterium]|nr:phosphoribosylformylglycinamidine synthase II [Candidatus Atribacteria bacterium]